MPGTQKAYNMPNIKCPLSTNQQSALCYFLINVNEENVYNLKYGQGVGTSSLPHGNTSFCRFQENVKSVQLLQGSCSSLLHRLSCTCYVFGKMSCIHGGLTSNGSIKQKTPQISINTIFSAMLQLCKLKENKQLASKQVTKNQKSAIRLKSSFSIFYLPSPVAWITKVNFGSIVSMRAPQNQFSLPKLQQNYGIPTTSYWKPAFAHLIFLK